MVCLTNINNNYDNFLFKSGFLDANSKHLNQDRAKLFYGVCIPVRTLIAISIFCLSFILNKSIQTTFSYIIGLFSLLSFIHLANKSPESKKCQWWSNSLEMFFAFLSFCICIYCISTQQPCVIYISIILGISILSGLIQSAIIQPFK